MRLDHLLSKEYYGDYTICFYFVQFCEVYSHTLLFIENWIIEVDVSNTNREHRVA